eukprot:scaffold4274_cov175-Amphora_coffeaeformis.AAC.15
MAPKHHHRTVSRGSKARVTASGREKKEAAQQTLKAKEEATPGAEKLRMIAIAPSRNNYFQPRHRNRDAVAVVDKQKKVPEQNGGVSRPRLFSGSAKHTQRISSQRRHSINTKKSTVHDACQKVQDERQTRYVTNRSRKGDEKDGRTAVVAIVKPVHKKDKVNSGNKTPMRLLQSLNFKRSNSKRSTNRPITVRSRQSIIIPHTAAVGATRNAEQHDASVIEEEGPIDDNPTKPSIRPRKLEKMGENDNALAWAKGVWSLCCFHPIPTHVKGHDTDVVSHVSSITGRTTDRKAMLFQNIVPWYSPIVALSTVGSFLVQRTSSSLQEEVAGTVPVTNVPEQGVPKETKEEKDSQSTFTKTATDSEAKGKETKLSHSVTGMCGTVEKKGDEAKEPSESCRSSKKMQGICNPGRLYFPTLFQSKSSISYLVDIKEMESSNDVVTDSKIKVSASAQQVTPAQSFVRESNTSHSTDKEESGYKSKKGTDKEKDARTGHNKIEGIADDPISESLRSCLNYNGKEPNQKKEIIVNGGPSAVLEKTTNITTERETQSRGSKKSQRDACDANNAKTGRLRRFSSMSISSRSKKSDFEKSKSGVGAVTESILPRHSLPPSSDPSANSVSSKDTPPIPNFVSPADAYSIQEEVVEVDDQYRLYNFESRSTKNEEEKDGESNHLAFDSRSVNEETEGEGYDESKHSESKSTTEESEEKDNQFNYDMLESRSAREEGNDEEEEVRDDDDSFPADIDYSPSLGLTSLPGTNTLRSFSFSSIGQASTTTYTTVGTGTASVMSATSLLQLRGCAASPKPRPCLKEQPLTTTTKR